MKSFSGEVILARTLGALCAVLVAVHVIWFWQEMRGEVESVKARESLRRLAALTIRNFPDRNLESPDLFWKSIGREGSPMQDAWGIEYRLEWKAVDGKRNYVWLSAGPDRVWGTHDDVKVDVPYVPGLTAGNGEEPLEGLPVTPPSTNAK